MSKGTYWAKLLVEGLEVDLSHLEPFAFSIAAQGIEGVCEVRVRFHDHCFTATFDPARHGAVVTSSQASSHERRAFDPVRYSLSKRLPGLVRSLDGKRIASTRAGNLVRFEGKDGNHYAIFFTLRREEPKRCGMFVVSAYGLDNPSRRVAVTGEMRFNTAVGLVLSGKKPKFPPR